MTDGLARDGRSTVRRVGFRFQSRGDPAVFVDVTNLLAGSYRPSARTRPVIFAGARPRRYRGPTATTRRPPMRCGGVRRRLGPHVRRPFRDRPGRSRGKHCAVVGNTDERGQGVVRRRREGRRRAGRASAASSEDRRFDERPARRMNGARRGRGLPSLHRRPGAVERLRGVEGVQVPERVPAARASPRGGLAVNEGAAPECRTARVGKRLRLAAQLRPFIERLAGELRL